jgi:hypothetical protein
MANLFGSDEYDKLADKDPKEYYKKTPFARSLWEGRLPTWLGQAYEQDVEPAIDKLPSPTTMEGALTYAKMPYELLKTMATGATDTIKSSMDDPTNAKKSLDLALMTSGAGGLLGRVPKGPGKVLGANVFQGGPHKYGPEGAARSLDHMGKGEGAQAYGYGRYDAQNKAVADDYYKTFSDPDQMPLSFKDKPVDEIWNDGIVERWGDLTSKMTPDEVDDFTTVMGNLSQVNKLEDVGGVLYGFNERQMRMYRDLVEPDLVKPPTDAYLYKHDLPDEDIARYLDWDKPLSEQPESVRAALKKWGNFPDDMKGSAMYEAMASALAKPPFDNTLRSTSHPGASKAASEALGRAGIPGLKYYDGMSRLSDGGADAKGTATRILDAAGGNYDKAIETAKGRQARNNKGPADPMSNLSKAIKLLENKFDTRTRNYVTWDQDVLDRMKLLERNGESMIDALR